MVFKAIFVAVPAFNRVDPVTTSGPTAKTIRCATPGGRSIGVQLSKLVVGASARWLHQVKAPRTYGVVPPAAMPITVSRWVTCRFSNSSIAPSASSSLPSLEVRSEPSPPAIMPTTRPTGTRKVGGASDASNTPSRPEVPAPT